MQLNPELVKRSLSAHSAIGLVVGVLMYLICLTGTLATLAETFERWEQPEIQEFTEVTPAAIDTAIKQFRAEVEPNPESLWVVFPTPELPRMHIAGTEQERFTRADGSLDAPPVEGWTHMLRELHMQLHLPPAVGLILVSALGAMLIGLIVSGVFAHPRLFKDAFRLRLGGSRRLKQADLHNRLSVWALPFHLMIGVTGAFYGLVGLLAFSAAFVWYDGDRDALFDAIYGADPVLQEQPLTANTAKAMSQFRQHSPHASPIYLAIHKLNTEGQFMTVAATLPGRLAYSEIYHFDAAGEYLGSQELTSGPLGRQVLYSLYRIHFGYFDGQLTRIVWFILGLSLTIVSVTGINIWLAKRNREDGLDHAWVGFVWGTPLALSLSALASVLLAVEPLPIFLLSLSLSVLVCLKQKSIHHSRTMLKRLCALSLAVLATCHWLIFPPSESNEYLLWVNGGLLTTALLLTLMSGRSGVKLEKKQLLSRSNKLDLH